MNLPPDYTEEQAQLVKTIPGTKSFLRGDAGTGKTTVAVACLNKLIYSGIPAETILILLPQRPLARPYNQYRLLPSNPPGGQVSVLTIGGLARRMVELFWPLVADKSIFHNPQKQPRFLTIETTQFYLSQIVDPFRVQGYFDGLSIEPTRLYGQILDNLNKTAVIGFPITDISNRLRSMWNGNQSDARFFDHAQDCAIKFREYCLEHSLLDFSLQLHLFRTVLWNNPICKNYLLKQFNHLIYDNSEEDYPVAHDIIQDWLPEFQSALILFDDHAGYRSFLGADPISALRFSNLTEKSNLLTHQINTPQPLNLFGGKITENLRFEPHDDSAVPIHLKGISLHYSRFYTQMLDAVVNRIKTVVESGTPPGEIAVLSPFISDSLRFSLQTRLKKHGIALTTHRPGGELRNEPAVRCLITLAKLTYRDWKLRVTHEELRACLMTAINGLDLIRAELLSQTLFKSKPEGSTLLPFSNIKPPMSERITYQIGEKYEFLREWISQSQENEPVSLNIFFSRCFGELLSQKGFGFHFSYDMADATDRLIESARQFGEIVLPDETDQFFYKSFLAQIENGIYGSLFLRPWEEERPDAILLSPSFTFLMRNQAVAHQFWLNPGSSGWWERLNQPLTHPVVLSRNWPTEKKWTDADEVVHNQNMLIKQINGLLCRCTSEVDIFAVLVDEQGYEPRGPLLQAINRFLRYQPGGINTYDA